MTIADIYSPRWSSNTCLSHSRAASGQKPSTRQRWTRAVNFQGLPTDTNSCKHSRTAGLKPSKKKANTEPLRSHLGERGQRDWSRSGSAGPRRGHLPGAAQGRGGFPLTRCAPLLQTRARRWGAAPRPLTGQHSPAACGSRRNRDRAQLPHGAGTADRAPPRSRSAPLRPTLSRRERREPDTRGPALPWASRPAPLPFAAKGQTATRRDNPEAPAEGWAAAPSGARSGGQRAAPRAPAPRQQRSYLC